MLDWPAYDPQRRATMVFDTETAVIDDYMAPVREVLAEGEGPRVEPTSPQLT